MMWRTVKLGDVATVIAGQSPAGENYNKDGVGTPFMQGKKDYGDKFPNPPTVWTTSVTKLAEKGDILMSVRAPVGALNIANQQVCIGRGLAAIRASEKIELDYLFYALLQISARLEGSSGAIFNSINKKQIEEIEFLLPPLAEQQRIVAKLDATFAEIDETIHATKIKIQNYFKLEEANKSSFFSNLSSSLIELEKTGEIINGYAFKSGDFQHSNGVPVIKITNVGIRDFVETNDVNLPKDFSAKHKQFAVKQGDIVFALTRTVINGGLKVAVVPKSYEGALLNQRVASVSANPKLMNSEFLYSYLSSSMVLDYVLSNVNTLMQPNLSITDLKKLPVPNIPIDKQLTYSQTLKETEIQFQNIRTIETKKLSELEKLKSSILAQELQSEAA